MKNSIALLIVSTLSLLLGACGGGDTSIGIGTGGGSGGGGTTQAPLPAGVFSSTSMVNARQHLAVILPSNSSIHSLFWIYSGTSSQISNGADGLIVGSLDVTGNNSSGTFDVIAPTSFDLAAGTNPTVAFDQNGYASNSISGKFTLDGVGPSLYQLPRLTLVDQDVASFNASYTGSLRSDLVPQTTGVAVTLTGNIISGSDGAGCDFTGSLTDTLTYGVYLLTISSSTGNCAGNDSKSRTGVAVIYNGTLYLALAEATLAGVTPTTAAVFVGH